MNNKDAVPSLDQSLVDEMLKVVKSSILLISILDKIVVPRNDLFSHFPYQKQIKLENSNFLESFQLVILQMFLGLNGQKSTLNRS